MMEWAVLAYDKLLAKREELCKRAYSKIKIPADTTMDSESVLDSDAANGSDNDSILSEKDMQLPLRNRYKAGPSNDPSLICNKAGCTSKGTCFKSKDNFCKHLKSKTHKMARGGLSKQTN